MHICNQCMHLSKQCLTEKIRCSGDDGFTTILLNGRTYIAPKHDDAVEFLGAYEEALARLSIAVQRAPSHVSSIVAKVKRAVQVGVTAVLTGETGLIDEALGLLSEAARMVEPLVAGRDMGWVECVDEPCTWLDYARAGVRALERRAAAIGAKSVIPVLNRASAVLYEAMRALGEVRRSVAR